MIADVKCPKCRWNLNVSLSVIPESVSFQAGRTARLRISGLEVFQATLQCSSCNWSRTLKGKQVEMIQ